VQPAAVNHKKPSNKVATLGIPVDFIYVSFFFSTISADRGP
jgi:hypothetical protein